MASIGILGGTGWLGRALGRDGISVARFARSEGQGSQNPGADYKEPSSVLVAET